MSKLLEKYLSYRYWLTFLKRQPEPMQHMYAVIFSATITTFIAMFILYFDYGFWRDTYNREDGLEVVADANTQGVVVQSPGEMLHTFFNEAGERLKTINTSGADLLDGKEEYKSGVSE